jgi:hypothetical protein
MLAPCGPCCNTPLVREDLKLRKCLRRINNEAKSLQSGGVAEKYVEIGLDSDLKGYREALEFRDWED